MQPDEKPTPVLIVAAIAVVYPVVIFLMTGIAFSMICGGSSRGPLAVTGAISLIATLIYGGALLALSTQKGFRIIMVIVSPGFGWGVVLVGAFALTSSGMIRPESRG